MTSRPVPPRDRARDDHAADDRTVDAPAAVERTGVLADDPAAPPGTVRRRLDALASLLEVRSPHLAPLVRVSPLSGGVAVTHTVPGRAVGLDRLRAAGPLRAGHVLAVALDVVSALEALSAAGLAHGGVTADRVLVGADGAAVLTATGLAWKDAPGEPGGPTAAEDVAAVGALVRLLLGRTEGSPLLDVANAATDPDPRLHPTLPELREALLACGRPDRPAAPDPGRRLRPVPRPGARSPSRAPGPRRRRSPGRRLVVVALVLLAGLGTARVVVRSTSASGARPATAPVGVAASSSPTAQPAAAAPAGTPGGLLLDRGVADWTPVLAALDAGRREALGAGSLELLGRWVDPAGTSWTDDAALVSRVATTGARLEGGDLVTLDVRPVEVGADRVVLLVRDRRTAYRVLGRDGSATPVPERTAAWWRVTLARGDGDVGADGWRLHDVEPAPARVD